jgi:putative tricarboxylic transport membrane protein
MMMAKDAGIAPKSVNYVPFDGGGELLASVLGGKVAFGVSGIGEYRDQIKSGELRLLAVTGKKRIKGFDAPTLKEAGMDVEFTNWRGIMAPPGLSEAQRAKLIHFFDELHRSPQWQKSLQRNGWDDAYLTGEKFGEFLDAQDKHVKTVLEEVGE